jgi:hypothetical protein
VRNDRFCIKNKPDFVNITIRKTYQIAIWLWLFFCVKLPIDKT